jgi:hypothetical protein
VAAEAPATAQAPTVTAVGRLLPPAGTTRFTPTVMAVDARGRLLVGDASRGTIFVWTDEAAAPTGWLTDSRSGSDRFDGIRAIATGVGLNIYVLHGDDGVVSQYNLAFEPQVTAADARAMSGEYGPVHLSAMGVDRTGQPVVGDDIGDRVFLFDTRGGARFEIGGPGNGRGGFRDPSAIAVAPNGWIWVADRGNRLVQVFNPLGSFVSEYALPDAPESLAIDAAGVVAIGDAAGAVTLVGPGGWRRTVPAPAGAPGTAYVAFRPDGRRLYVSRPVPGVVETWEVTPAAPGS